MIQYGKQGHCIVYKQRNLVKPMIQLQSLGTEVVTLHNPVLNKTVVPKRFTTSLTEQSTVNLWKEINDHKTHNSAQSHKKRTTLRYIHTYIDLIILQLNQS